MSRLQQFNSTTSEKVTASLPNQNGTDFNILHGAGPNALPATIGTAQGNSSPDYQGEAGQIQKSVQTNIAGDPHGALVTNYPKDGYTTRAPFFDPNGRLHPGLTSELYVPTAQQDVRIGNDVFGKSVYGSPEVQITNYGSTRDTYSVGNNQNPTSVDVSSTTASPNSLQSFSDVIPSVGTRFYRG